MRMSLNGRVDATGRTTSRGNPMALRSACMGSFSWAAMALGLLVVLVTLILGQLPLMAESSEPESIPDTPDKPTATAIYEGMVDLEWNDVPGATSYDVQAFRSDWFDLPGNGVEIAFYGPGAIIKGLIPESRYYFRVRANNALGSSDWSEHRLANPTGSDFGNWDGVPEPTNRRATGAPTISGTAQVGKTLTADLSDVVDKNGLDRVKFHYQWVSNDGTDDSAIDGATEAAYVLANADEGRFIKVRVNFTDRGGYEESATSPATEGVEPPPVPGPPRNLQVSNGENGELALSWDPPTPDGSPVVTGYKVRWKSANEEYDPSRESAVSGLSFTVRGLTNGGEYTVRVVAVNEAGEGEGAEVTAKSRDTNWPEFLNARVVGSTITLTYNEALDANSTPAPSAFSVLVSGTARKVSVTSVAGSSVRLILAAPVTATDTVVLSYSAPQDTGEQRIRDPAGHDVASFSEVPMANGTPAWIPWRRCSRDGNDPTPTAVEVGAVPIVVESTTEEYFVLYARPDLDAQQEIPVSVTLGQGGTTTLIEQLPALPKEHYRVEKFLIADPGDVDFDCIGDVTELQDVAGMNPLNPAPAIRFIDGAVAIPDHETFEALSYRGKRVLLGAAKTDLDSVKFFLVGMDTDRPLVYFMNTEMYLAHGRWQFAVRLRENLLNGRGEGVMLGQLVYHPNVVAPNGSLGVYRYEFQPRDAWSFEDVAYSYEVLAASMRVLDNNLAYYPLPGRALPLYHEERALYDDSRVNVLLEKDILPDVEFIPLNLEEGYGFLRVMSQEERPNPRDIVIYETLPNELPRVAGIITTVPQTPLSHVNLRAVQDGVPNAFIRGALDDDHIDDLIGSYVHYTVAEDGWTLRAATPEEVDAHYAASRPAVEQVPERDLTVTQITPLSQVGFDDWDAFGVKAANVAMLRTLGFPDGTVPDGFAVPFYFYDDFMKHNGFYGDVEEMLADPEFQSDYDTQEDELKKLRKKIKKGGTPQWMTAALEEMHAAFPEGASMRYRSSTNNEDLPGFSGAGLYDSKTQHPEETEEDGIAKSLKQVFASLWNFRAFTEREFHRIDHLATAMGVLVHPNYSDELVNGVAVSFDPFYGTGGYYVNTQVGEDLVTNPEAHSAPEEVLLHQNGTYEVLATSNLVPDGRLLMSDAQMEQLRVYLEVIHDRFERLYNPVPEEPFGMEIEFKITSENVLAIKQARPWVFSHAAAAPSSTNTQATGAPAIIGTPRVGSTLTADTSGIADADELTNVVFHYQWIASDGTADADVAGATGVFYTPAAADVGKTVKVRVSFTDDQGNAETLTSAPTVEVVMPPLTASYSVPEPHDGQTAFTFTLWFSEEFKLSYLTLRDHAFTVDGGTVTRARRVHQGSNELWRIHVQQDSDAAVTVVLPATVDCDAVGAICTEDGRPLSNRIELTVAGPEEPGSNRPATGAAAITGAAQMGWTLRADASGIGDPDGLDNAEFSYQWVRNDGSADMEIAGATGGAYIPGAAELGQTIKVRVSFTDDASNAETRTSPATAAVVARPLTVTRSVPAHHSGLTAFTFALWFSEKFPLSYLTLRDHAFTVAGGAVTRATRAHDLSNDRYDIWRIYVQPDGDDAVSVVLPATVDCDAVGAICTGDGRPLSNRVEFTVAGSAEPAPNSPATGAPTIDGAARVGETLRADTSGIADDDELTNAVFSYQWLRGDTDIAGATGDTYTLVAADEGQTIKVRVSFTDDTGNQESRTSAATAAVDAKPNSQATGMPVISGMAQVGQTLTADTSGINDDDGLTNGVFSYQWLADDAVIAGATGATYTLVAADEGKTVKVKVSFTDDRGNPETLTSDPTGAVAAAETVPGRPQDLDGEASAQGIALTWKAPSGSSVTQYVVYRGILQNGSMNGQPMTEHATVEATGEAMEYTDAGVEAGVEYRYRVAAVNSAGEGRKSGWVNVRAGS